MYNPCREREVSIQDFTWFPTETIAFYAQKPSKSVVKIQDGCFKCLPVSSKWSERWSWVRHGIFFGRSSMFSCCFFMALLLLRASNLRNHARTLSKHPREALWVIKNYQVPDDSAQKHKQKCKMNNKKIGNTKKIPKHFQPPRKGLSTRISFTGVCKLWTILKLEMELHTSLILCWNEKREKFSHQSWS